MEATARCITPSNCTSSRKRSPTTSSSECDAAAIGEDSSSDRRQSHPSEKASAAKKRKGEGEENKEGSDERIEAEVNNSEEIEGGGDVELMRVLQKMNIVPVDSKRRSQPTQRFNISAYAKPRSSNSSMSDEDIRKQKQRKELYQKLLQRSAKLGKRHRKHFNKRAEDDPDMMVKNPMIDFEVFERGRTENAEIWDKRAKKGDRANAYQIDYLVSTELRQLGEPLTKDTEVLIKWTDYPHPTWEPIDQMKNYGDSRREFDERMAAMDLVEFQLRSTLGDAEFEKRFPNRYLVREDGEGKFGYVTNERSLYVNRLRAIESRWKFLNARDGLPRILIEDWTNLPEDDKTLEELMYINYVVMNAETQRKVAAFNQLQHIKCHENCVGCVDRRKDDGKSCCYARGGEIMENYVRVECTSLCSCGHTCKNRVVQNGRQLRLALFRDSNKGWGVRAMKEIAKDEFIDEYAGEMLLESGKSIYDFLGSFPATERHGSGKKLFRLTNRAGKKGNITRFFNHSCEPNLHAYNVQIERYGRFFLHTGFFTCRKIDAGEELTFKYFQNDEEDMSEMLPHGCSCGTKRCCIPPPSQSPSGDEEEKEIVGGEETDDSLPSVENDETEEPLPLGEISTGESINETTAETEKTMVEMEEEKEKNGMGEPTKREEKGPSAHSGLAEDESTGEEGVTTRRRSNGRHLDESLDDVPFSTPREAPRLSISSSLITADSPLESPSKDDKGKSGEKSGVAKKRSLSLGGTREREEETQSQEDESSKKAYTVVREEGVKKEGTVVRKTKKLQEIDFSSDEEEEKENVHQHGHLQ